MIKKDLVMGLLIIAIFLSGCATINQLYGLEPAEEGEFVSLEDIKVEEVPEESPKEMTEDIPEENITEDISEETPEEIAEESIEQPAQTSAKVLIVKETDTVSLKPSVLDPDEDAITITYTTPLNEVGSWTTNYGDEGEYTVTVTASDGQLSASKDVLIIVNKKEEAPSIDSADPDGENLDAVEDSEIAFSITASDLNEDPLVYTWTLDGEEVSSTENFNYVITFDGSGEHALAVTVSDGTTETSRSWTIEVANVNRQPVLEALNDVSLKETETVVITPAADDPDGDTIEFSIDNENFVEVDGSFEWETTYDDAGSYTVTVSASDGTDDVSQEFTITVENVNRAPIIDDIVLG